MIKVSNAITSFKDIPSITATAQKSVLLLRHSYRESLQNGNHDPNLTAEGRDFAISCGKFLKGMKDVCFGSSSRRRTIQTVEAIIQGGDFENGPIITYPHLHDTAMFSPPEGLANALNSGNVPQLLKEYFTTGTAPGMIGIKEFSSSLANFLTCTVFKKNNVILATHDILLIALLSSFKVYPFQQDDWCGYVQGAFLYQDNDGVWTMSYAVPDKANRKPCRLFV